jgi:hypothetical protein
VLHDGGHDGSEFIGADLVGNDLQFEVSLRPAGDPSERTGESRTP